MEEDQPGGPMMSLTVAYLSHDTGYSRLIENAFTQWKREPPQGYRELDRLLNENYVPNVLIVVDGPLKAVKILNVLKSDVRFNDTHFYVLTDFEEDKGQIEALRGIYVPKLTDRGNSFLDPLEKGLETLEGMIPGT